MGQFDVTWRLSMLLSPESVLGFGDVNGRCQESVAPLAMVDQSLLTKVHELSDLELAVLLCLVSREHCLISTPSHVVDDLVLELQLVAERTFGLEWTVIDCNPSTTLDDFVGALLGNPSTPSHDPSDLSRISAENSHSRPSTRLTGTQQEGKIVNFVIAKNLDQASQTVQIQALELLRTRRVFTHRSVQVAPKQFVFIPVIQAVKGGYAHVTQHLNDFLAMAHWHDPEHGFVNLEDGGKDEVESNISNTKNAPSKSKTEPLISEDNLTSLREAAQQVRVDIDVIRYQMNIVSFLRMHRAVAQGITPMATKHFDQLMRNLAPLHKLEYVTPALVDLAAKKIYLHRIRITEPENERSMQWGSTLEAVTSLLDDIGPEEVIEETLEMVTAPV